MIQLQPPQQTTQSSPRAWLRAWIPIGFGVYFAYNIMTGNLSNYINVRFIWLSYTATFLFFLIGFAALYRLVKQNNALNLYGLSNAHNITWTVLGVALVPLFFGFLIPPQPLSVEAVNGGISTRAVLGTNELAFVVSPEDRNVLDWLRMFGSSADYTEFNGQPVDVIGFIYREPDFEDNQLMVARFTVSCCVADASALGLPIQFADASNFVDGEWVRVVGEMQLNTFVDDELPVVIADSIEIVPQPEHPYLYP